MEDSPTQEFDISITIKLDVDTSPVAMTWSTSDGNALAEPIKAMYLSLCDSEQNETIKIDLWTKQMSTEDMKNFFHKAMISMTDSFEKATGETEICKELRHNFDQFAHKMNILSK